LVEDQRGKHQRPWRGVLGGLSEQTLGDGAGSKDFLGGHKERVVAHLDWLTLPRGRLLKIACKLADQEREGEGRNRLQER